MNRWLLVIKSSSVYRIVRRFCLNSVITPFRLFFPWISFGRPLFPGVFCLYPSEKSVLFELKVARNSSEWLCLFHDVVSLNGCQSTFCAKFYDFSMRRLRRWRCYFAGKLNFLTIALPFINRWNIMLWWGSFQRICIDMYTLTREQNYWVFRDCSSISMF